MEFIEDLFIGKSVMDLRGILADLRRGVAVPRVYCIVYFEDRGRLELLSSRELLHARNRSRPAKVAGIAMGRREAIELLGFMARTAWESGRDCANPQEWIL